MNERKMSVDMNTSNCSERLNWSVDDMEGDEEETYLKQPYFQQASDIKSEDDFDDDFQPSQIPNQEFYCKLDTELSNKPKDEYVGRLLSLCNNDAKHVNWYRDILADRTRRQDHFLTNSKLVKTATSFFLPNQKLAKRPCNSNCFRDFKPL